MKFGKYFTTRLNGQILISLVQAAVCWLLFVSASANANSAQDFEQASKSACEKLKSCAMAEMVQEEGITPEMRKMIQGMVDGLCENIMSFEQIEPFDDLYQPATACMNSMAALSCSQIEDDVKTNECDEFEAIAKKYDQ